MGKKKKVKVVTDRPKAVRRKANLVESPDARPQVTSPADAANLVLQPTNSQKIDAICCCCSCCCGILAGLKRHPKPAQAVANAFRASLDPELCLGCLACLDRCQIEAIIEGDEHNEVDLARCIGCGLCVSTCPEEAIEMVAKAEVKVPPENIVVRDIKLATERGLV